MDNNKYLFDKRISWRAKGLITLFLQFPESQTTGKTYLMEELTKISKESLTSVRSAFRELLKYNYLSKSRFRNQKGYSPYIYKINLKPEDEPEIK